MFPAPPGPGGGSGWGARPRRQGCRRSELPPPGRGWPRSEVPPPRARDGAGDFRTPAALPAPSRPRGALPRRRYRHPIPPAERWFSLSRGPAEKLPEKADFTPPPAPRCIPPRASRRRRDGAIRGGCCRPHACLCASPERPPEAQLPPLEHRQLPPSRM